MNLPKLVHGSRFTVHRKNQTVNCEHSTVNRKSKGFSLIELLTVITIIGILVAVGTVSWTNAQQKARDGKRKSDLKSVQQALELYFQEFGTYPTASTSGEIQCIGPVSIPWGSNFQCVSGAQTITYLNPLPKDQTSTNQYYYSSTQSTTSPGNYFQYVLSAALENTNDPEYCTSGSTPNCQSQGKLPCEPATNRNYCVIQP